MTFLAVKSYVFNSRGFSLAGVNLVSVFSSLIRRIIFFKGHDNSAANLNGKNQMILSIDDICVKYGGVDALSNLSLSLEAGRIYGLIGPNGAGKSTTINVITGITQPSKGKVTLGVKDITVWPAYTRARHGLSRTFQNLALFKSMTVCENVICGMRPSNLYEKRKTQSENFKTIMRRLDLEDVQNEMVESQSLGTRKRIELARALMGDPSLLLLDEPAAGLSGHEVDRLSVLLQELCEEGLTVLIVEHDMALVMSLCQHIFVLDFGCLIAQGTPTEVQANTSVQAAYFGDEHVEWA